MPLTRYCACRWSSSAVATSGIKVLSAAPGGSTQGVLQVTLHRVELGSPVLPAVGSVGGEVEQGVVAASCVVGVLELLVDADHEVALKEGSRQIGTAQFVRSPVAAVHPEPGVIGDELADVDQG